MNITINSKLYKKFQNLEECKDLTDTEVLDYFQETLEDLIEDLIIDRINKENQIYDIEEDENDE
ncbi:MAG: hypothetical protein FJZ59_07555 [Chlamydiae bacterium]|nr:hypothetical protein [Chlamydiota bacterium]